jgi:uncharacterized repeat protein (TIGR01451 family)
VLVRTRHLRRFDYVPAQICEGGERRLAIAQLRSVQVNTDCGTKISRRSTLRRKSYDIATSVAFTRVSRAHHHSTTPKETVMSGRLTVRSVLVLALAAAALVWLGALTLANVPQVPPNTWTMTGDLTDVRAGAASTLLYDGRVFVSGGQATGGVVSTVDLYSPDGGQFHAASPMTIARANHTATLLPDGRVLVAGGQGADGRPINSAEVYDPANNQWATVAPMHRVRSGHTATSLYDGRVVIAGGDVDGAIEIFDASLGTFELSTASLGGPRTGHAAALLYDGRVLIVGGFDGTQTLSSTAIFDAASNTMTAGGSVATARAGHSATTLLSGKVLVAGGANDTTELGSAEIYNPSSNNFSAAGSLAAPRQHHQAFLLPHNNQVLIVGGTANGNAVTTAETYVAWQGNGGSFFAANAPAVSSRAWATGAPLSFRAELTVRSGPNDGLLLLAGGSAKADASAPTKRAELYGFATVKTDKADYAPGQRVTITGSGWVPGETVTLTLTEEPFIDTHALKSVRADGSGNIMSDEFVPDEADLGVKFYLTATGGQSQAQTSFTDASKADLQGQSAVSSSNQTGTGTWITGNLANWQEQSPIPMRVHLTSGPDTNVIVRVDFDHTKTSGTVIIPGIENLTNFTWSPNVTMVSPPALSAPAGADTWSYSFTVSFTGSTADVNFTGMMAIGANNNTGSSLALGGSPSLGQLQVSKPQPQGTADLSIVKTGPGTANPSQTIAYTLAYQNKSTTPASNAQITDTLPAGLSYVSGSCSGGCSFDAPSNTLTWNLGGLAGGASGSVTFQAQVTALANQSVSNTGRIRSSSADPTQSDNQSTVTTNVVASCTVPNVSTNPSNVSVTYGDASATFTSTASGSPTPTVQWQVNSAGTWTNLTNASPYSGVTTTTLTISSPTVSLNGNQYRAVFTNTCGGSSSANSTPATLTVNKAALSVTADADVSTAAVDPFSKSYDGQVFSPFTVRYAGFVNSETAAALGGTLSFSGAGTTATAAGGPYTVTPTGLTSSNYLISFIDGTLTITKAALTVTADADPTTAAVDAFTKGYNGQVYSGFTVRYAGLVNSEAPTVLGGTLSFTGAGTTATAAGGPYTVTPGGLTSSNYQITFVNGSLMITKAALTILVDSKQRQYSDPDPILTGTVSGLVVGDGITVTYATTATTNSNVGSSNWITATVHDPNSKLANYTVTNTPAILTITQEDARASYTGPALVFGATTTATSVTVPLRATIQDITAVPGDPAYDAYRGDITTAKVYFVNRDAGNATLCQATLALIDPADPKTATATCSATISLGGQPSQSVLVGIVVGLTSSDGNYTRNSSDESSVVTVSQPLSSQFITGGGYLLLGSQTAGLKAGDVGSKNNFGFNAKYNSKGTNLQGRVNTIIRRTENGMRRIYQVKGNNLLSLGVMYSDGTGGWKAAPSGACTYNASATCLIKATFTASASIQDVTDPLNVVSVEGSATVQLDLIDSGEPGSTGPGPDTMAITVWNKSNNLWYSSKWSGSISLSQLLDGGNLVVH